jgi:hypothetical protein
MYSHSKACVKAADRKSGRSNLSTLREMHQGTQAIFIGPILGTPETRVPRGH